MNNKYLRGNSCEKSKGLIFVRENIVETNDRKNPRVKIYFEVDTFLENNLQGKYLEQENTQNRKILLEMGKYWWGYSIWKTTREENWRWKGEIVGGEQNWKECALIRKYYDIAQELIIKLFGAIYKWKMIYKGSNHEGIRGEKMFDNDSSELLWEIRGHIERG